MYFFVPLRETFAPWREKLKITIMKKNLGILFSLVFSMSLNAQNTLQINADFTKVKGNLNTMFKECVGAGRANEGLRADWQRQLTYAKQQCDFKYIRMHGLLTDDMGVYKEDKNGNPIYNWQYIDELYDYLRRVHIKPFVELGFMPEALASGNKTIFWWKGNITPPKDYQKWSDLITNLVKHFTERYGADDVKTWYFEVWNEPNLKGLFWSSDQDEFFKLYDVTAKAIKRVSPVYKVGGPATAGSAWIPEFIKHCADNKTPVDFVSTHTYAVDQGFLDEKGETGTVLSKNRQSIYAEVIRSRKQIAESALPNLELHYTEWSASYTPNDPIHDSYHEASFILDKIKHAGNAPNSMSYWVFSDIFEEAGPRMTPFHGGFGLINYQDINKPAFYAYQFLNKLGDTELASNPDNVIITKNDNGDIQALCWDFTITNIDSINNQVYYKRELPSKNKGIIKLSIKNIPAGKYNMAVYKIGYRSNDAYTTYLDLGSPSQLTKQQVAEIKQRNNGSPLSTETITISTTGFEKELPLRENDVYFIEISKVKNQK